MAFWTSACERVRQQVGEDRHLPLAGEAIDVGRRRSWRERRDVLERNAPELRRGDGQRRDGLLGGAVFGAGPQVDLVLFAGLVVGRHLIAADEQSQRFGGVADLHAEVGRLRPIDLHRQLGLADVQRAVDVHDAWQRSCVFSTSCWPSFSSVFRSGPLIRNCTSAFCDPPPPMTATGWTEVRRFGRQWRQDACCGRRP